MQKKSTSSTCRVWVLLCISSKQGVIVHMSNLRSYLHMHHHQSLYSCVVKIAMEKFLAASVTNFSISWQSRGQEKAYFWKIWQFLALDNFYFYKLKNVSWMTLFGHQTRTLDRETFHRARLHFIMIALFQMKFSFQSLLTWHAGQEMKNTMMVPLWFWPSRL